MRILSFSWEYPPHVVGGIGSHVADLLPELGGCQSVSGPVEVDLVTPRYAGGAAVEQINPYVTVHRVEMPPVDAIDHYNSVIANNRVLIEYASQLANQRPYDLIHIHEWLTGVAGIVLKHRWKTPLVATIHGTERGRHQGYIPSNTSYQINQLEWKICYEAWRVIVCSQFMRSELQNYFNVPNDKVHVIANGVKSLNGAACTPTEVAKHRQRFAPNGERLLFFVGRIVHEKGLHVLIRAMPRILGDYPNTRLLVAGKNGEKMWPLAYELNVERSVDFLGFISNHERDCIYQIADAAIFPSLYEPFGIVALEAMTRNCNVIVSDVGGLREVVEHQRNGLTVYPDDPQSIVWAVEQLFINPEIAQSQRDYAQQITLPQFQWDKIAQQTARLYQSVIQERMQVEW